MFKESLDKPKEECGVFGIYNNSDAAYLTFLGLYALQHRGQESVGIVSCDGVKFYQQKQLGLVSNMFNEYSLSILKGSSAIGHVRYSTTGSPNISNIQPLFIECSKGYIGLAHNGNIVNSKTLRDSLSEEGSIFQTSIDSEIILHLIAKSKKKDFKSAIAEILPSIKGAYSIIFIVKDMMIAVRDPWGFRPLCIGELGDSFVFASESCAFDLIEAKYIREVMPGEMVIATKHGLKSEIICKSERQSRCIFEYIYFARPDSIVFGKSIYHVRKDIGRELAKEHPVDADIVISVPDSGNCAALGFSEESKIPYDYGLIRNHYVGRTFIKSTVKDRELSVKIKLSPIKKNLEGKRIVVVDDSIVRGTTSKKIVKILKNAGAKQIHFRVASPPYKNPCYYGVDTPVSENLIASNNSIEEIKRFLNVDSLGYLSMKGLLNAVNGNSSDDKSGFCTACFDGDYPVKIEKLFRKDIFE